MKATEWDNNNSVARQKDKKRPRKTNDAKKTAEAVAALISMMRRIQ